MWPFARELKREFEELAECCIKATEEEKLEWAFARVGDRDVYKSEGRDFDIIFEVQSGTHKLFIEGTLGPSLVYQGNLLMRLEEVVKRQVEQTELVRKVIRGMVENPDLFGLQRA